LWNIKISKENFLDFCAEMGKDVPFFYYRGCCIVKGAGEKIFSVTPWWKKKGLWIVLVYPNRILLTKDVYAKFDQMNKNKFRKQDTPKIFLKNLLDKKFLETFLYNDLYLPATKIYPKLSFIRNVFINNGTKLVSMSGSGSTIFGAYYNKNDAKKIKNVLEKEIPNSMIKLVKTIF